MWLTKQFDLVALDIATGNELWRREDLAVSRSVPTPLRMVDDAIPALIGRERTAQPGRGRRAVNEIVEFALIEACSGENIGTPVSLGRSQPRNKFNGDFGVWPGTAVLGFTSGIRAFRLDGGSLTGEGL